MANDFTDLGSNAIFVPMMYRMAILGQRPHPLSLVIGEALSIQIPDNRTGGDEVFEIKNLSHSFIPEQKSISGNMVINPGLALSEAGNYDIATKQQPREAVYSFNYNRSESDMSFLGKNELMEQFSSHHVNIMEGKGDMMTQQIVQARSGKPLWKLCIIFALAFLLLEVLLLRLLPS